MALRILHTADWHLGHSLHGIDRAAEHEQVLRWLLDALEREAVDALFVAGDVFDAANPPVEAQLLWSRFLVEAWRRVPHLQVVVVGGNHDSASRLEVSDPFLRALERLHVFGAASGDPERLVVPLSDRGGVVRAWVAAVPYLRAADTGAAGDGAVAEGTRRRYAEILDRARQRREQGQALLAIGHLYLVGGRTSDLSERKLVVGTQSAVPADVFPEDLAYVALGHLHLAQPVGAREQVRYSGSPLPLSLAERTYEHQVLLVDLEGERAVAIRPLLVPRFLEILRVPATGALSPADVVGALAALPRATEGAARPLLAVCVRIDSPEPALRQKVEAALDGKAARLVRLGVETCGSSRALGDVEHRRLGDLSPEHVFRKKYERDFGGELPADLLHAFQELSRAMAEAES